MGIDYVLKNSLLRRSLDNVTVVIIAFNNFKHSLFGHAQPQEAVQAKNSETKETENKAIDAKAAL